MATAEEAKEEHVRLMGKELGLLYDALWQHVAWLYDKWSEYVVLFGTKESRVMLMNKAAPAFTRLIQDTLWENVILHIALLSDPPKSAGKPNLTIQRLPALISDIKTKEIVESKIANAITASEFCRDWRNRHIAHRDLNLALELEAEPLKPASRKRVREALESLAEVLNSVSSHYLESTTYFDIGATAGGALSLLYVVDDGINAATKRKEKLKSGIYDPSEYKPRDI